MLDQLWNSKIGTVVDVPLFVWEDEPDLTPPPQFGFGPGRAYDVPVDPATLNDCEACQ